ncbi:MAG TPA: hypothetical protein VF481_15420 [Novosphingobium sp.]
MQNKISNFAAIAACSALALMPLAQAHAQPRDVGDLQGARAPGAEMEMQRRGYQDTGMRSGTQYWWNASTKTCAGIVVANGRYASVSSASASDCKQGGGSGAAAAVVGIAAIGLIAAALASHHKDTSDQHRAQSGHDAEFQRGYNDAIGGSAYDNRDSEGYHEGYMAGDQERTNRRNAGTNYAQNVAPRAALDACSRNADSYQNQPSGSSVPISGYSTGAGRYEVVMATGRYRSRCSVDGSGRVSAMNPL